jgi:hypothetical protein
MKYTLFKQISISKYNIPINCIERSVAKQSILPSLSEAKFEFEMKYKDLRFFLF